MEMEYPFLALNSQKHNDLQWWQKDHFHFKTKKSELEAAGVEPAQYHISKSDIGAANSTFRQSRGAHYIWCFLWALPLSYAPSNVDGNSLLQSK